MSTTDFVPVQELSAQVPDMPCDQTEIFLEHLVRKALCECRGAPVSHNHPMVSVIVPARNREKDLAYCLRSLSGLRYPAHRLEIIVVDDASSDGSFAGRRPISRPDPGGPDPQAGRCLPQPVFSSASFGFPNKKADKLNQW
jgi:hypothetical protein